VFGIAVFLFGFSLTPEGRRRGRLFAGTAGALAVAGAINAGAASLRETAVAPDAAAASYAHGMVALEAEDEDLLEEAEEVTQRAVAADPREPVSLFNLGLIQLAPRPAGRGGRDVPRGRDDPDVHR
jgi:hypothetical protein